MFEYYILLTTAKLALFPETTKSEMSYYVKIDENLCEQLFLEIVLSVLGFLIPLHP